MNNMRFFKTGLVVMVLLNIFTITYLWIGKPSYGGEPHTFQEGGPFRFLSEKLHLTSDQISQYETMRDEHHSKMVDFQMHSSHLRNDFFKLMQAMPIDSSKVIQYSDSLAKDQKQIELITFYHFLKLRSICTREQQKIFDGVIGDALKMMGGALPPHG